MNEGGYLIPGYYYWEEEYSIIMDHIINSLNTLSIIADKELAQIDLSHEEKLFIKETYIEGSCVSGGRRINGWLGEILKNLANVGEREMIGTRASLISSIFSNIDTGNVLHAATGVLEHLIAIVPHWNGTQSLTIGPVFSYYEFTTPNSYRMTDEDWRGIIQFNIDSNHSDNYHFSLFQRGFWAESYMISTVMTKSLLLYNSVNDILFEPPKWFLDNELNPSDIITIVDNPISEHNPYSNITIPKASPYISILEVLLIMVSLTYYIRRKY